MCILCMLDVARLLQVDTGIVSLRYVQCKNINCFLRPLLPGPMCEFYTPPYYNDGVLCFTVRGSVRLSALFSLSNWGVLSGLF